MTEFEEIQSLVKDLRKKFDETQEGLYTKAEFKAFEEKINARIEELETKKLPAPTEETKDEKVDVFLKYLREGKGMLTPEERKSLVSDTTGQILIPEALEQSILRALPKLSVMTGLASSITIGSDRIRTRSMNEVQVGWGKLETGTTMTEATLTPGEAYQYVEDLYGLTKVGEDELQDSDINLQAYISDSFSRAISEAQDTAFIKGTGHTHQQPDGILNSATTYAAGQAAAITADDLIKLSYQVPAQFRKNGVFIVNSSTEMALRLLKDSSNHYLWQPSLTAGKPSTFAGYAVYTQDDIDAIPQSGSTGKVAIFGDIMNAYRIVNHNGITLQRLLELYAESGLVGFKVHKRVGGSIIRTAAVKVLEVPAT